MPAFHARDLEQRYAFVDECPEELFGDIVTLPIGTLETRVRGIGRWREALLRGRLPPDGTWPGPELAGPALSALRALSLARFCRDEPELVDAVLRDVLQSLRRRSAERSAAVQAKLRELEALERQRRRGDEDESVELDEKLLQRLRARAERETKLTVGPDPNLLEEWEERARAWAQVHEVFGDLGSLMGRGWDLSRGVLRHTGWLDVVRLRELIRQLPQVREIVASLGRLQHTDEGETVTDTVFVPVRRLEEERREVRSPLIPAETRGVERSGSIARMLPSEAALFGHPVGRLLWHARRAERALMTYRVEGVDIEVVEVETEGTEEQTRERPRPIRGPILAIVDTSGSMHGTPEKVAKALVLEALRTAHSEGRRCYLYAYSGPGQVLEHELDLTPEGVGRLLAFLGMSFGGGNDEAGMLRHVVDRLETKDWKRADVVFVSDGEWPAPRAVVSRVEAAKESGTRFHGVQVGNRGRTGLHAVCEPVHVFTDWGALGR